MNDVKIVLGLCVTGDNLRWAMAANTILSAFECVEEEISYIFISTDQADVFKKFIQLEIFKHVDFKLVAPSTYYSSLVPEMKGTFATYWKFDLFNALKPTEFMIYIDIDAFFVSSSSFSKIVERMIKNDSSIAAVPSQRPVLERSIILGLRSPFDYFNAGVLMGFNKKLFIESSIRDAYQEIIEFDGLELIWHDQDIFNFLCRNNYFKLSYNYNASTGYYTRFFQGPDKLNYLVNADLNTNAIIQHVSGDFLLTYKYHPAKNNYVERTRCTIKKLTETSDSCDDIVESLHKLERYSKTVIADYILQLFFIRKRNFANNCYKGLRFFLKMMLSFGANHSR